MPDSIMNIEVTGATSELAAVIEEAAILFANGQVEATLATLTHAVREQDLGVSALQIWLMLFDLYLLRGMKAEFDALGMDFAVKFERSPPIWFESRDQIKDPLLQTGGGAHCALGGTLSAGSATQLNQLRQTADKKKIVRMDFSALEGVDPAGCALLIEMLATLKKLGCELMVSGQDHLIGLLRRSTEPGRNADDPNLWLALLELYQLLGRQDEYEEAALNYAITYEVSPPSWENRPVKTAAIASAGEFAGARDGAYFMRGELRGNIDAILQELAEYIGATNPAVLDMTSVKRIDFVSAGALLNLLTRLNRDGKTVIHVRGANELVIALFVVMGIQKLVRIIRHK